MKIDKLGFTPGPWYEANSPGHQGLVISESTGMNIAVTYDEKDAALIAAAPEMLEALIEHCDAVEDVEIDSLLEVIEKATGKTWKEIND